MTTCECDLDFRCGGHGDEEEHWMRHFSGIRPSAGDVREAYAPDDYKGRFWEGWDA